MKTKSIIFHIFVTLFAFITIFSLSGLPEKLHLTPARILLIVLVCIIYLGWFALFRCTKIIIKDPDIRGIIFYTCLLYIPVGLFLMSVSSKMMAKEGVIYSIGAFLLQARPFFIYLFVLCISTILLQVIVLREYEHYPIRTLLYKNHIVFDIFMIFVACLMVYAAFIPVRENYYPSHDFSIFAYIGQQILRGKMPYTELWDHKPPVIFYLNALGLKLTGGSLLGIWILEFLLFFSGSVILFFVLKKKYHPWLSLPVLLCGTLHYVRVFDFGNYTEEISLFFVIFTLALNFSVESIKHPKIYGFLSGLLCGLAFTCKQNTIGCWCSFFMIDLFRFFRFGKNEIIRKEIITRWCFTAIGFFMINFFWVGFFAYHNALSAYWDVAFRFNFIYAERSNANRLACALTTLTFLPSVSLYLFFGFISWIYSLVQFIRYGPQNFITAHPLTAWALIDLPVELFFAGISGMNYQHYFILSILPVMILICSCLNETVRNLSDRKWIIRTGTIILLFVFSFPLISYFQDNYMPRTPSSYTKIRDYLLSDTDPEKPILVWGSRTAIYVMSERYAPTAYFNERPLYLFPAEVQEKQWKEFLRDISKDSPQIIIYTHDTALPFIMESANGCKIPEGTDFTDDVYRFFCENYRYETTINPEFQDAWDIYRINSEN